MATSYTDMKANEGLVIQGLKQNTPSLTNLIVQGKPVTVTQAIAVLQARVDAIMAAQAAKVALAKAVALRRAELGQTDAFVNSLVTALRGMYAGDPALLAQFGQQPRKSTPLTAEQKVAASERRAATRRARHTMGAKQKLAIKGTVPAAPAASPATASTGGASASPAPAAATPAAPRS